MLARKVSNPMTLACAALFPASTRVLKPIPKTAFYQHLAVSSSIKDIFTHEVESICWCNKIAADTLNLEAGKVVTEIEVFEVALKGEKVDERVLEFLESRLPYHLLFLLTYGGKVRAWMSYKSAAGRGEKAFTVVKAYETGWMECAALSFGLRGPTVDDAYEGLVEALRGGKSAAGGKALKERVEGDLARGQIEKQLARLEARLKKETQPNKVYDLELKIAQYKKELKRFD